MEVKNWTYEEIPEFEGRPESAAVKKGVTGNG